MTIPLITTIDVTCPDFESWQAWARRLAVFGTDGIKGRSVEDPILRAETFDLHAISKRQGWYFSSCAHGMLWMLESLGVTDPKLRHTNKADNPLSRIAHHPLALRLRDVPEPFDLSCGDIVWLQSHPVPPKDDSHVMMYVDKPDIWASWGLAWPVDAQLITRHIDFQGHGAYRMKVGHKYIKSVLPLSQLWRHASQPVTMRIPTELAADYGVDA